MSSGHLPELPNVEYLQIKKVIAIGVNLELVAKWSENSNFWLLVMTIDDLGGEHSAALQQS